ncbi:MAG: YidH family protein [Acidimicrobiales bacterium]
MPTDDAHERASEPPDWIGPDRRAVPLGSEPDYRFTLANERTFLAWIRTALALAAGGLGALNLIENFYGQEIVGFLLLGLSATAAVNAYRRWRSVELAMRLEQPLPNSRLPMIVALGTTVIGLAVAVLFALGEW